MTDETEFKEATSSTKGKPAVEKRACLIMIKGDYIGHVFELKNDITTIGREDDAELVVAHTLVSRRHAMINRRVDGYYISDLDSTNGVEVNVMKITEPTKLNEGDKVEIGDAVFKFSLQDSDDAHYHKTLRNMAVKDGLTQIYNKRYFNETLEKEFNFNRRHTIGLALVLFDIDHFKQVNDTWGHPAGDFILKHLAKLIEGKARGYEVFARYGGEEFVFLLRAQTLEAAVDLAERVRADVENHVFSFEGKDLKITSSFGVTWWGGSGSISEAKQLVDLADKQLYVAKHDGRNCVRYDQVQ